MFASFTGSDFHVESFPGDMSFGELSLIKSQSHLRSHIRIDQFSYSWNCSWPLVPWALIQNQQHGHWGLKQQNWVRLQEASKSTEGKIPNKAMPTGQSQGFPGVFNVLMGDLWLWMCSKCKRQRRRADLFKRQTTGQVSPFKFSFFSSDIGSSSGSHDCVW